MIVVYGANGKAGVTVCQALERQELAFAMAGRSEHRLAEAAERFLHTSVRVAQTSTHESLLEAFEDADVVINCAGPFSKTGDDVIHAALSADCHYIDISAEQGFVRSTYERFDSISRKEGRVIVSACAFDSALADWAAHVAAKALDEDEVEELTVSFAVPPQPNTKAAQLAIVEAAATHNLCWEYGRWVIAPSGGSTRVTNFPSPVGPRHVISVPSPSVITVPRHVNVQRMQSYVSIGEDLPLTRAASSLAPIVAPVLSPLLRAFARSAIGETLRATIRSSEFREDEEAPAAGSFSIVAEARSGESHSRVAISGMDIYAITGGIACLCAERLLNEGEMGGVRTPSEILDPALALEEIAEQHQLLLEVP